MTTLQSTVGEARRGSDYAGLARQIRQAQLLDRRRGGYAARITLTALALVATWTAFVLVGNSWWQPLTAVALGVAFTQIGFLGHDGGHQQVTVKRAGNDAVALVAGNLLTGLSMGWWVDKHNRHHANPNKQDHDPDIGDGILAFTTEHVATRTGLIGKAIVRYQAWLFFPLLTLEGINLHVASIQWLRGAARTPQRRLELSLLAIHAAGYFGLIFTVLPPVKAVVFIAIHQGVWGLYMGCSFAPNHKGMAIIGAEEKIDYLRRQVLTSRNVRGGWFVDLLLGGLNYQVEHHLFPSMPRGSLRKAQRLVREYCSQHAIVYTETGLLASYVLALSYLNDLGRPLRVHAS
jgi:fatty acid desaturase